MQVKKFKGFAEKLGKKTFQQFLQTPFVGVACQTVRHN
jgi:hypothetical protein